MILIDYESSISLKAFTAFINHSFNLITKQKGPIKYRAFHT
jgi:hypothetical protein